MMLTEVFHFLHVAVFAVLVGVELPALYALRVAALSAADGGGARLALRIRRWTDELSGLMLILMLPLGVQIATSIGVYTLMSVNWLIATWIVALVWLALAIAGGSGRSALSRRLYVTEAVVRIIIGLGNIYDAVVGFMGTGMIQTNWLATKILLFGVILVVSGAMRYLTRGFWFADLVPESAVPGQADIAAVLETQRAMQWGNGAILAMVLVAAWMGVTKPW